MKRAKSSITNLCERKFDFLLDFNNESSCYFLSPVRMDTTDQCNAVISHFNGKFIKIASGALGRKEFHLSVHIKIVEVAMSDCQVADC